MVQLGRLVSGQLALTKKEVDAKAVCNVGLYMQKEHGDDQHNMAGIYKGSGLKWRAGKGDTTSAANKN